MICSSTYPLSYLLSWPFSVIDERLFLPAFIVTYWLSNLLGLLMMHWGGQRLLHNNRYRLTMKNSLLVSVAYTLIILMFTWQGWLASPARLLDYLK